MHYKIDVEIVREGSDVEGVGLREREKRETLFWFPCLISFIRWILRCFERCLCISVAILSKYHYFCACCHYNMEHKTRKMIQSLATFFIAYWRKYVNKDQANAMAWKRSPFLHLFYLNITWNFACSPPEVQTPAAQFAQENTTKYVERKLFQDNVPTFCEIQETQKNDWKQ